MGKSLGHSVAARLAEPFDPSEVGWKPQAVQGERALMIAFVSARTVMDRLDEVVGVGGWKDDYETLAGGEVLCRLSLLIDGQWVTKADVGGQSDQPDGGDRVKSAVSDALKRTAVKFGVGRYLYRLKGGWVPWDQQKRQARNAPQLPAWALPEAMRPKAPPKDGVELKARLAAQDATLALAGKIKPGSLVAAVLEAGVKQGGCPNDFAKWPESAVKLAAGWAREFLKGVNGD